MVHGIGILCLILLCTLFPSPSIQKVDSPNATNCENMELQETCKTIEISKMCKTTPYCIHCLWNTAFNPNSAVDRRCNACQKVMEQENFSDSTEDDFLSLMENGCNIHMSKRKKSICSNLVQSFVNRSILLDVDRTNVSSFDICSLLGFCYSKFQIIFETTPDSYCPYENDICIIHGKDAATAKSAKVYSLGTFWDDAENGNYHFTWLHSPIFARRQKSRPFAFKKGPDSIYSCQFFFDPSSLATIIFASIAVALHIVIFALLFYVVKRMIE